MRNPEKIFQPIMAPTIACDVETGNFKLVMRKTVTPAEKATVNAQGRALIEPSLPSVCEDPEPLITAPEIIKIESITAAVLKRTIFVVTAVPKIFAASFAPRDHPKKSPLDKKKSIVTIFYTGNQPGWHCNIWCLLKLQLLPREAFQIFLLHHSILFQPS